jgi:hypothetical protein
MIATRPAPKSIEDAQRQLTAFNQTLQNFEKEITQLDQLPPSNAFNTTKFNVLQEVFAFYTGEEYQNCLKTIHLAKTALSILENKFTPRNESYDFNDATFDELNTLKEITVKSSSTRDKLDQIAGAAFRHCTLNGIFGDIFKKPVGSTPIQPAVQASPTNPSNNVPPPLFLVNIRELSKIAELFKGNSLVNNWEIVDTLDKLGISEPYKHLYFMHLNTHNNTKPDDPDYGKNAMMGQWTDLTNHERLRAIQRTIVVLALDGLEKLAGDVQQNTKSAIQETINILETMAMDSKDLPLNRKNMTHVLFENLFKLQHAIQHNSTLSTLADPLDRIFESEFGRYALLQPADKVPPKVKADAIINLRNTLEIVWMMKLT